MEELREVTHLVIVGFTPEKLIASVRQFPVHKVVIVMVEGDEKREKVMKAVNALEEAFRGLELEKVFIDRENVFKGAIQLIDIIEKELKSGREVKINIAGGMRNVGISAYMVSLVSGVEVYSDIPASDNEHYKIKGILKIPPFPIKELPPEQMEILRKLDGGVGSLDELVARIKPELKKGTQEYNNERSRLSHHIKKLEKDGFIETKKVKKNLHIKLTILGEIYIRGKELKQLNEERKK